MSIPNRPSYATTATNAPLYSTGAAPLSTSGGLNQTYTMNPSGGLPSSYGSTTLPNPTILPSSYTTSTLPSSTLPTTGFSSSALPSTSYTSTYSVPPTSTLQQPLAGQSFVGQPLVGQSLVGQPLAGQTLPGQQNLPNPDIELKKRMLDKHRDLKMKEAEMETNKEKKLEEKAEKQREKAVKWVSRGIAPNMAHRHEAKADKLEHMAHEHHMKAESYKLEAKTLEAERKSYDPPKEDKKTPAKTAARPAASSATAKKEEIKHDAAKPTLEKKTETTVQEKKVDPALNNNANSQGVHTGVSRA